MHCAVVVAHLDFILSRLHTVTCIFRLSGVHLRHVCKCGRKWPCRWELQPLARVDAQVHRVGGGGSVGVGVIAVHEWEKLVAGVQ